MASLLDAFVQIDTVRGYRYLDEAGRIMNAYDQVFPEKNVGLDGLSMKAEKGSLKELQVSVGKIWLHFANPDTLTLVVDQAAHYIQEVTEVLAVTQARRFGFRAAQPFPRQSPEAAQRAVNEFAFSADARHLFSNETNGGACELRWQPETDLGVTLRLSSAIRAADGDESLPRYAVLVDFDIYRAGSEAQPLAVADFKKFARRAESVAKDASQRLIDRISKI